MLLTALLLSCSRGGTRYRIGVSQCSEDIWRDKQNDEMRMATYFHDNLELCFAAAYDSDERQVQQIDSLVATGIDLLIVAPNQVATISPAIDRAYDKGIPVIVFERKTNSQKYTAFMSADNYEMGRVMGEYVAGRLHGKGRVMEVMGLKGSSPAIERHNGFMDAMKKHPDITVLATLQGDWTEASAVKAVQEYEGSLADVDFVFGQNDRMAMGARKVLSALHPSSSTKYCGIDGLPDENGGIELVRDSILDATYIYPTNGDLLINQAVRILENQPYEKETRMKSALVTHDNASVLLMQYEAMRRQSDYLNQLHDKADNYLHELDIQRVVNWLAFGIIILLVVVFVLFYLYHRRKVALQRERVVNTLWNLKPEDVPLVTENSETPPVSKVEETSPASEVAEEEESSAAVSFFITRFKEVVEARLADSDISVEDLAADMNISRVQLYRKVKALTGSSPVELLRIARLSRAYQLLLTTDKSVSEVAYAVGFTSPSYFTKCFKDEYGKVPGEARSV